MVMDEDAAFGEKGGGAGQNPAFDIASNLLHLFGGEAVVDGFDTLANDRSFIEVLSRKMCSSTNDFYASFIGLMVWFCTLETGSKRVMDVDNFALIFAAHFVR